MGTQPNAISGAGSGPAEPVVADPEIVESPTAIEEPVEPDTPAEPEADPEPGAQPETTLEANEDARKLPGYVKQLKESNPEAYKRAKAEFYDLNARRSLHPTVQAALEEHQLVASNGGAVGIAKLREDGQFFKSAQGHFLKGDRAFYQDLWEADPTSAALGLSHMLELAREKDPATYKPTLARLWDSEFQAVGFANGVRQLLAAIEAGDKEAARSWAEGFEKWHEKISGVARQAEDPRVKTLLAERAKQHETREQSAKDEFLKSYRTETTNQVVEDGAKVFDSFFKGRKIDPDDRNDLLREAFALANRTVVADTEFIKQRDVHLAAGDSAAAIRLSRSRYAREMEPAVKRIARRYGMFSGPAKPAAPTKPGEKPANGTPDTQGFVKVNQRPSPDDIDFKKSPQEMRMAGRAVLKNGRKIDWAHLRKAS